MSAKEVFLAKCLEAATAELARVKSENTELSEKLTVLEWQQILKSDKAQTAADVERALKLCKATWYQLPEAK